MPGCRGEQAQHGSVFLTSLSPPWGEAISPRFYSFAVSGSSCNLLFFVQPYFRSFTLYVVLFNGIPKAAREAKKYIEKRKEEKMISQKRELHELPCLLNLGLLDPGSTTLISLSWSPFCFFFWNIICSDSCYELSCFSASLFPASLIHPSLIYSARWCLQFVLCVLKGRVSQDSLPPFPEQQTHLGPW